MARYFKRTGSEVVEIISEERTASPNIWWPPEQMTIHGFTEVKVQSVIDAEDKKAKDAKDAEALIAAKTRELAISALKAEGKLGQEGKVKK